METVIFAKKKKSLLGHDLIEHISCRTEVQCWLCQNCESNYAWKNQAQITEKPSFSSVTGEKGCKCQPISMSFTRWLKGSNLCLKEQAKHL